MKILLAHNRYKQPGGEDQVFAAEAALLEAGGQHVVRYTVHNDQVEGMSAPALAGATLWNRAIYRELRAMFRRERPDVVHFHNTFPLVSPAAYHAARAEAVPVVQTLHNYRLLCPNAMLMREGRVCEDCLGRAVSWAGAARACYRESRAASGVTTLMLATHRALGTWREAVDVYVALTEFARRKFVEGHLPADKIVVKPNFVEAGIRPSEGPGDYALFVGRLSPEKGVGVLLGAWRNLPHIPLKILGDGPLIEEARAAAREGDLAPRVEVLGRRERSEVLDLMRRARVVVFPSQWYEGFPLTIAEAFACGVPVIASRLGAMEEIVADGRTGLHFTPGDAADLATKIAWAWAHEREMEVMGREARREYEKKYTAERNYRMLTEIYRRAIKQNGRGEK
ncbi:MAG: glycosyltransferase [Acidobacteria bacterium]|nr:glycosyltransferase [Acidobacteriota bacterium]